MCSVWFWHYILVKKHKLFLRIICKLQYLPCNLSNLVASEKPSDIIIEIIFYTVTKVILPVWKANFRKGNVISRAFFPELFVALYTRICYKLWMQGENMLQIVLESALEITVPLKKFQLPRALLYPKHIYSLWSRLFITTSSFLLPDCLTTYIYLSIFMFKTSFSRLKKWDMFLYICKSLCR